MKLIRYAHPRREGVREGRNTSLGGFRSKGFMYPEAERVVSDRSYHEVTIQYFVQWLIWSGAKGDTRQNG
jgi:hypothetical protein